MLKIKCDINQQDLKTVDLHFVKSEYFSLTWSCGSRQRDTTSSGWKFRLNNLAVKGLIWNHISISCLLFRQSRALQSVQCLHRRQCSREIRKEPRLVRPHKKRLYYSLCLRSNIDKNDKTANIVAYFSSQQQAACNSQTMFIRSSVPAEKNTEVARGYLTLFFINNISNGVIL